MIRLFYWSQPSFTSNKGKSVTRVTKLINADSVNLSFQTQFAKSDLLQAQSIYFQIKNKNNSRILRKACLSNNLFEKAARVFVNLRF
jgi:hypothetical protein